MMFLKNDFKFIKQIIDNLMCDDLLFLICVKKVQIFCKEMVSNTMRNGIPFLMVMHGSYMNY